MQKIYGYLTYKQAQEKPWGLENVLTGKAFLCLEIYTNGIGLRFYSGLWEIYTFKSLLLCLNNIIALKGLKLQYQIRS